MTDFPSYPDNAALRQPDIVDQLQSAHEDLLGEAYERSIFLTAMREIQRLRGLAQGQPNLKQIEAAIDEYLGNIDATYEDSRRRCAQNILDLYAVPSTEGK